ncbi:hypothetical protein U9R90_02150, partial [Streptomyces sp. E11-3]|uniref:hypothetical protein n=1 Tax=Streptomyces sp. E11-3 TaxID=3110112 RepID=UPI00397E91DC
GVAGWAGSPFEVPGRFGWFMKSLPQGERTEEGPAGLISRRGKGSGRAASPAVAAAQTFKANKK